ncbi:hypothetical protein MMC28_009939 [Mycoblastus sanguinarius]|nr:hypothetical protein [Mycoblastus sanguinarius]
MSARLVNKSAPKWEFLHKLELTPNNPDHRALYGLMKSDAVRGYDALLRTNRSALKPDHARSPPPFAASWFTDADFLNAVQTIYADASPQTRALYNKGRMANGDNWVIGWVLYHVCRYRDGRNQKKAVSKNFHDDDDLDPPPPKSGPSAGKKETPYYDAARNGFRTAR